VLSSRPTSTDVEMQLSEADFDVLSTTIDWIQRSCPIVKRVDLISLRGTKLDEGKTVRVDEDDGGGLIEAPFADADADAPRVFALGRSRGHSTIGYMSESRF
jgi:hypothetical protein